MKQRFFHRPAALALPSRIDAPALGMRAFFVPHACFAWGVLCMLLVSLLALSPGIMSPDTLSQLSQAMKNKYNDISPPVMAWWWGWLMRNLWPYPSSLLLFHLTLFWFAVYVLGCALGMRPHFASWLAACLWFVPPVFVMTATLWKDSGMAISWLAACALLVRASLSNATMSWPRSCGIALLLFYGAAARHNSIAALLPLCFWFADRLQPLRPRLWKTGAGIAIFCTLVAQVQFFNKTVTHRHVDIVELLLVWDIERTEEQSKTPTDSEANSTLHSDFPAIIRNDRAELSQLFDLYFATIYNNPEAYLRHRWIVMKNLLGIGRSTPYYAYQDDQSPNTSTAHMLAMYYIRSTGSSGWFRGYYWLTLNTILLCLSLCYYRRNPRVMLPIIMLNLSACLYVLPYFFIALSCEFRFLYWSVVSGLCSLLITITAGSRTERF